MSTNDTNREPVEALAEEFVAEFRKGGNPSVSAYAEKYPEHAERIQALFPALVVMEQFGSVEHLSQSGLAGGDLERESIPQQLGEYRILRLIGRGGMGVVYEAVHETLGRHVALKVLPSHRLADPIQLDRFRQEARAAAQLHHTNIVPVFDVGEHGGLHYYAMQFIPGRGLDEILIELKSMPNSGHGAKPDSKKSPTKAERKAAFGDNGRSRQSSILDSHSSALDISNDSTINVSRGSSESSGTRTNHRFSDSVARIGLQVADALDFAHRHGVLHRDIKPSNLLLDVQGRIWVADFGLAKMEESDDLTKTGGVVGTLRYMPPERLRGISCEQGDIYSLGATLYELLTTQPLFADRDRVQLMDHIARVEPARPRKIDPAIPPDLENIVLKSLEKDVDRRYATAAALAEDLRHFLSDLPVNARQITLLERSWRWCRRNPAIASLTAAIMLLLATIAIGSTIWASSLRTERETILSQNRALEEKQQELEAARQSEREKLWQSYWAQARASRSTNQAGGRLAGLAALSEAARIRPAQALRDEAISCLSLPDMELEKRWLVGDGHIDSLDFDKNLGRCAAVDDSGAVVIRDVATDKELTRIPVTSGVIRVDFSPTGQQLVLTSYDATKHYSIQLWDLEAKHAVLEAQAYYAVFSPDGTRLATQSDGLVWLWDTRTGGPLGQFPGPKAVTHLAFDPTGQLLAVTSSRRRIQIWNLKQSRLLQDWATPAGAMRLAWRSDGRLLAVGCDDSNVYVYDARSGKQLRTLTGHVTTVHDVAFHPQSNWLFSHSWDGRTKLWDVRSGKELVFLRGHYLRSSQDGQKVAVRYSKVVEVYRLVRGPACRELYAWERSDERIRDLDIGLDDRLLASGGDGGVRLWNLATGEQLDYLDVTPSYAVRFDHVGKCLIVSGHRDSLSEWPIKQVDQDRFQIGPPRSLGPVIPGGTTGLAISADGNLIAACSARYRQVILLRREPHRVMQLVAQPGVRNLAFSPDGNWLAAGTFRGIGVRVWNTETGLQHDLPVGQSATVAFTADGEWLVSNAGEEYQFWSTGGWKPGRQFPRPIHGSRGGCIAVQGQCELMAVSSAHDLLQMRNTAGQLLANLEPSNNSAWIHGLQFDRQGRYLTAACGAQGMRVWDLRQIRSQLAAMGLDWRAPPRSVFVDRQPRPLSVQASWTPEYAAEGEFESIDFQSKANCRPESIDIRVGRDLQQLPRGAQSLGGIKFGIGDKFLQLRASDSDAYPSEIIGIPLERQLHRLHFLHATRSSPHSETIVAHYEVSYEDKTRESIPVTYRKDVCSLAKPGYWAEDMAWKVAWTSKYHPLDERVGLYHTQWDNPHPEKKIVSIDFVSKHDGVGPLCVAMTAESFSSPPPSD